jgi:dolichol-phosphate mannosyltransferase
LALGLGLLSKLYTVFLGIGVAAYVALYAQSWLRRREAYLAGALALLVLAPVIYWNIVHDWATVRFLLFERKEIGSAPGLGAITLLLTQHLPLVLVLFPAFAWALWAAWRRRSDERFGFLFWTSVPALAIAFLVAPLGAARGHWMGPGYIALAVVLAALWTRPVTWLAAGNAVLQAALLALVLIPALPPFPGAREYYGWKEAGARVREEVAAMLPTAAVIVADRYQVASQLGYYTRDTIPVLLLPHPDPGSIWPSLERFAGVAAVVVTYAPERFQWEGCFDRVEERPPVEVRLRGRVIQEFRVFRLFGLSPSCGTSRNT